VKFKRDQSGWKGASTDFSQAAKLVIDVAIGQVEDRSPTAEDQGKDPAAAAMGKKGGAAAAYRFAAG
jgi:hypothetical protein